MLKKRADGAGCSSDTTWRRLPVALGDRPDGPRHGVPRLRGLPSPLKSPPMFNLTVNIEVEVETGRIVAVYLMMRRRVAAGILVLGIGRWGISR